MKLTLGKMVEWSITPVLKTGVPRGTGGSNPSLSATMRKTSLVGVFLIVKTRAADLNPRFAIDLQVAFVAKRRTLVIPS